MLLYSSVRSLWEEQPTMLWWLYTPCVIRHKPCPPTTTTFSASFIILDPVPLYPHSHRDQRSPSNSGPAPCTSSTSSPSKLSSFDLQPRTRALLTRSYATEVILNPASTVSPHSSPDTHVSYPHSTPCFFFFINIWNCIYPVSICIPRDRQLEPCPPLMAPFWWKRPRLRP